ncbi:MAG: penicillin-binding protein 2 [Lachnospiraceae bacterium]|nr:penicillin-binding protein 2 [Lachnospiraceae bacterium]
MKKRIEGRTVAEEEKQPQKTKGRARRRDKNKEFAMIAYFFIGIFLAMIVYFTYFQFARSEQFINNPYNTRLDGFAKRVVRGDIVTDDGKVLATTKTDADGNETREYPKGRTYAHVVGYADNGKAGLESGFNFELLRSHSFILERVVNEIEGKKNQGDTLVTTLHDDLQQAAYQALGDRKGAVVVLEPDTGKILAMVSKPDFDPNTITTNWDTILANDDQNSVLLNRVSQGLYPPGSTFKLVTALEYIREHPNTYKNYRYDCTGSITADNYTLHCFGNSVHGDVDLKKSLAKSCNSSFANIGLSLDLKNYAKTCEDLLFNKSLPAGFPSSKSRFSLQPGASDSAVMATAIGQGDTLVSPLHMALIVSAIQNEGVLMNPYLVQRVENSDGNEVERYEPSAYGRLMSEQESKILRGMMRAVVTDGTASALASGNYTAAGKTGSAEFGMTKGESHAWFVGYATAKGKAPIAIAVVVEGAGNGGTVSVPIAKSVFDTYFK